MIDSVYSIIPLWGGIDLEVNWFGFPLICKVVFGRMGGWLSSDLITVILPSAQNRIDDIIYQFNLGYCFGVAASQHNVNTLRLWRRLQRVMPLLRLLILSTHANFFSSRQTQCETKPAESCELWCLVSKDKAACDAKTKAVTAAYGVVCMKLHIC